MASATITAQTATGAPAPEPGSAPEASHARGGLNKRTRAIVLLVVLLAVAGVILVAGLTMPAQAYAPDYTQKSLAPSLQHLFGTDYLGHDMFSRTIRGLSLSILIGLFASLISGVTALVLGSLSAIVGGWVDHLVLWLADLFMSVPHMVLLILISFAIGGGATGVIVAVALTHWPSLTRLIRAEVLRIRTSEYVAASRSFGKRGAWIARSHVWPNVMPQFIVGTILLFPHAILHESALTFLGFGLSLDSPAIGAILSQSMKYISTGAWWLAFFPGLMMVVIVLLTYTLGDDIKQLIDPRSAQE